MGFFSKIFKGVKKVFKKIGKGIKKVATKVGKFMDKIGVVGQIALAFILPGIGSALASTLGNVGTWAAATLANPATNALVKGVAHVVNGAVRFAAGTGRVFNTVTSAVKNYVGEVGKTMLNKIPGINIENASTNIFGSGGALEKAAAATGETFNTTIGSKDWWDGYLGSPENTAKGFMGARRPEDFVSTQQEYDDFFKRVGSDMESRAVTEVTSPSLLDQYSQSPVTGQMTEASAKDFIDVYESVTPVVEDVVEVTGFNISEKALSATALEGAKQYSSLMAASEPEFIDMGMRGQVIETSPLYQVGQSQVPVGFGAPQVMEDMRQFGGMVYTPRTTYASRMT